MKINPKALAALMLMMMAVFTVGCKPRAERAGAKKLAGGARTGVRHPTPSGNFCAYLTSYQPLTMLL